MALLSKVSSMGWYGLMISRLLPMKVKICFLLNLSFSWNRISGLLMT